MPTNRSVWQDQPGQPGTIRESEVPSTLDDRQVLVKVHAWAVNPCDAILQDRALPIVRYPVILGQDVAGTVEAVGPIAAGKFKVGDAVFGFSINNGFQEYVLLDHTLTGGMPPGLSFSEASVFGLCVSTSAYSLFSPDHLALPLPSLEHKSLGKSILIWGASSSVGSNAIQLAKGAGLEVIATCSPRNFDYVKGLGADKAFDYNSPTVIDDVATELDKGVCAGIYLAAGKISEACKVSAKSKHKLFVSSTNPVMPGDCPDGVDAKMAYGTGGPDGFKSTLPATFGGYLIQALNNGVYKVAPPPHVVPAKGVEGIQDALDELKKGISAKKLVIEAQ